MLGYYSDRISKNIIALDIDTYSRNESIVLSNSSGVYKKPSVELNLQVNKWA